MKVLQTDNNNQGALTRSELEALAQFEASDRRGRVVFRPWVGPAGPAPHCVALLEGLTRIAVTYLDGECSVRDGHRDDEGTVTPVDDVLERCWQAAMAVRARLKRELEINAYVVAAAVFANMEPEESILAAAGQPRHPGAVRVGRPRGTPGGPAWRAGPAAPAAGPLHPRRCGGAEPPAGGGCRGTGDGDGDPGGGRGPRGDPR